jgi:TPP-dependent indolepyruvate ferredoxin oxidoreductase alpha subunit
MDAIPSSETVNNVGFLLTTLKTTTYKSISEAFTDKIVLTKTFVILISSECIIHKIKKGRNLPLAEDSYLFSLENFSSRLNFRLIFRVPIWYSLNSSSRVN